MLLNKFYLLIAGMCVPFSHAVSTAEFEKICLELFEGRAELLNENMEALKKSVYSYIPYSDHENLETAELPPVVYQRILEKCGYQYDVFYAGILSGREYNFLVIKNNRVFVWKPYLKVPGSSKKRYSDTELRGEMKFLEEKMFQEKKGEILIELVGELKKMKEASWEIEEYSNPLQPEVVRSIVKVLNSFWKLQPLSKGIDSGDLSLLNDFLSAFSFYSYYGLNSTVFGVSLGTYTVPGTPAMEVWGLMERLIDYACDPTVQENDPETYFDLPVEIMEYDPFIKQNW